MRARAGDESDAVRAAADRVALLPNSLQRWCTQKATFASEGQLGIEFEGTPPRIRALTRVRTRVPTVVQWPRRAPPCRIASSRRLCRCNGLPQQCPPEAPAAADARGLFVCVRKVRVHRARELESDSMGFLEEGARVYVLHAERLASGVVRLRFREDRRGALPRGWISATARGSFPLRARRCWPTAPVTHVP